MRIFLAIWPPPEAADALFQWAQEAHRQTGGRTTAEEKIHLTLAFLGDADPARAISAAQCVAAKSHMLPIEQARYWPKNNIVWVGPRETPPALKALADSLSMALGREAFILERRPFAAHVTLIRKARAAKALPALPVVDWPVTQFVLVRSKLSSAGSSYETLERFSL
jgi:RNA 2',3'-cyclic 3'-phosphodiesterase